jgi:hypothetical protein
MDDNTCAIFVAFLTLLLLHVIPAAVNWIWDWIQERPTKCFYCCGSRAEQLTYLDNLRRAENIVPETNETNPTPCASS